jgi:hypothetical protein
VQGDILVFLCRSWLPWTARAPHRARLHRDSSRCDIASSACNETFLRAVTQHRQRYERLPEEAAGSFGQLPESASRYEEVSEMERTFTDFMVGVELEAAVDSRQKLESQQQENTTVKKVR